MPVDCREEVIDFLFFSLFEMSELEFEPEAFV